MNPPLVVCNASPIIALNQIDHLFILETLFSRVHIPPAVAAEVCSGLTAWPGWIHTTTVHQNTAVQTLGVRLGPGESEAICLALQLRADWICLDERPARRTAESLGLQVVGTLGLLLAAKRRGFIPEIAGPLNHLTRLGFRVSPKLCARVLADAQEEWEGDQNAPPG